MATALYKINHIESDHILNMGDVDGFLYQCEQADRGDLAAQFFGFLEQMKLHFIFEDETLNPNKDWIFLTRQAAELTIEMWIKFWGQGTIEEFEILDVTPKVDLMAT